MIPEYEISRCLPAERPAALRLLHDELSVDQQSVFVQTLDATREQGEAAFAGLLVAKDSQGMQGVVWVQFTPGQTAVVWPPANGCLAGAALMENAAYLVDERCVKLTQILANPTYPVDPRLLSAGGFQRLAKLAYLQIRRANFPHERPATDLEFVARASEEPLRLGDLLLATYEGSLDCPELNGRRAAEDILAGYQAQGIFSVRTWFFVRFKDQDIGVLILAKHADGATWELVYMGVTPAGRGRGFGRQIVQFALWQASCARAERVVLAVDDANDYAIRMYENVGFEAWDRRTVYVRFGR